eukprot:TRINITY_DN2003_c0_g1_i1.p1 TRINITY_DN2003_c0_g1~~TRINITY_DN2003_c0_g1_i1.p1  ORF type:complete len:339 (+),score=74.49 TRINITY_DN2003_c0_g1_i1:48-1019(+)
MTEKPKRWVFHFNDMKDWNNCDTFNDILSFIDSLILASSNVEDIDCTTETDVCMLLVEILNGFEEILNSIDPIDSSVQYIRYGNPAFRLFVKQIGEWMDEELPKILLNSPFQKFSPIFQEYKLELNFYLNSCWGSDARLDYGTGHELNIFLFLFCLNKIEIVTDQDLKCLSDIFLKKYWIISRKIIKKYNLEAAGSKGVWGLDDYHFLCFAIGAMQLQMTDLIPEAVLSENIRQEYLTTSEFVRSIQYVFDTKFGVFSEHSPMLAQILSLRSWKSIRKGLFRMFISEVFSSFPVVQHIHFCRLITPPGPYPNLNNRVTNLNEL